MNRDAAGKTHTHIHFPETERRRRWCSYIPYASRQSDTWQDTASHHHSASWLAAGEPEQRTNQRSSLMYQAMGRWEGCRIPVMGVRQKDTVCLCKVQWKQIVLMWVMKTVFVCVTKWRVANLIFWPWIANSTKPMMPNLYPNANLDLKNKFVNGRTVQFDVWVTISVEGSYAEGFTASK